MTTRRPAGQGPRKTGCRGVLLKMGVCQLQSRHSRTEGSQDKELGKGRIVNRVDEKVAWP